MNPKEITYQKTVRAFQYDGSEQMAQYIQDNCEYSWMDYEHGRFAGLNGFTKWGLLNNTSCYVMEGDYLIKKGNFFRVVAKEEFENEFKKAL